VKPFLALLSLLAFLFYLLFVVGSAGAAKTDSETSRLTLTVLPAVEIEISKEPPLVDSDQASSSFSIRLWANTAWAISEPEVSSPLAEPGACTASRLTGPRNFDNAPQEIEVLCLQPMSWADGPGSYLLRLDQIVAAPLSASE
jgi:hypothetical protein